MKQDQIEDTFSACVSLEQKSENELFLMALMTKLNYPSMCSNRDRNIKKRPKPSYYLVIMNGYLVSSYCPKKNIYTLSNALEQHKPLPLGIKFCDAPALFEPDWEDMKRAIRTNKL